MTLLGQASTQGSPGDEASDRVASLIDFNRRRKAGSREKLLAAATAAFCQRGYFPVSVEDIATAAGVSRMTFYRHFSGKAELVAALFEQNSQVARPLFAVIGTSDHQDRNVVIAWITGLFSTDRAQRHLLRVFIQANVDVQSLTEAGHNFIDELMNDIGAGIAAFAVAKDDPAQRRRYIEAWLLIYEILDQSNHAARDSGVAADPMIVEILADRFLEFVARQGRKSLDAIDPD